ncbi:tyrosine-type recombinase/integrase, partial [Planctomycetota bacterium]
RQFLNSNDFSVHTIKAFIFDIRKFALYFTTVNNEPFDCSRITTMDLTSFKRYLREEKKQAVSTVNRALVSIRRYLDWLVEQGKLEANPGKVVKELRRQQLVPKGLERSQVRKLLREIDLRNDIRSKAIFTFFLNTGCRVSDLVQIELQDLMIGDRSGSVVFRNGKGSKERQVPLTLDCRRALQEYLAVRPPVNSQKLFIGERGALTDVGVRSLCNKYSCICGFNIYPHLLRHSFALQFLKNTNNDIVALAQILGHENLNTTKIYSQKSDRDLAEVVGRLSY